MSIRWSESRRVLVVLLLATHGAGAAAAQAARRTEAEARKVTERILARAIVIDTHADTPQMMLDEAYDLADPSSPYMVSIPKMRAGHLGGEFSPSGSMWHGRPKTWSTALST